MPGTQPAERQETWPCWDLHRGAVSLEGWPQSRIDSGWERRGTSLLPVSWSLRKWTCPQARSSCRLTLSCVSYCGSCGFCSVMQSSPGREALFIGSMGTHLQSDFYWGYSEVQIPVNTGMTAVTWAAVFTHARSFSRFLSILFLHGSVIGWLVWGEPASVCCC